jgi:DNA-binding response OmpR family regulator
MLHQPPIKVLLAEDDRESRQTLTFWLMLSGYEVSVAEHGIDVIFLLQHTIPDVVIYSLSLPAVPGYDVLTAIRAHHAEVSVIAMANSRSLNETDGVFSNGFFFDGAFSDGLYIKDKHTPDLLLRKVADLLRTSASRFMEHKKENAISLRAS